MIEVYGLSRRFGEAYAVRDLSFEVGEGEVFGLLGPNGAGKTTIVRILSTVLASHEGKAIINGYDVASYPREVRESIGVLTTRIGLYERFTARENVEYFARLYGMAKMEIGPRVDYLLELLGATGFQHQPAAGLSSGMRQKVAIARSIVHDPQVIIFDEPTLGLDVMASKSVREFISDANREGKTVILSTHDMHLAEKTCGRLAILHQGKLVACGDPKAITSTTGTANLEEAFLVLLERQGGDASCGVP